MIKITSIVLLLASLIPLIFFDDGGVYAQQEQASAVEAGEEAKETIQIVKKEGSPAPNPSSEEGKKQSRNVFDDGINFIKENFFPPVEKDNVDDYPYKEKKNKEGSSLFRQASEKNQDQEEPNEVITKLVDSFKGLVTLLMDDKSNTDQNNNNKKLKRQRSLPEILEEAKLVSQMANERETNRSIKEILDLFMSSLEKVQATIQNHLEDHDIQLDKVPLSFLYYMEREDEVKNPSWKRRIHRYYRDVKLETAYELHNSLYLSHLSYADTVEDIQKGVEDFSDDLELVYAKTEALPGEPAHFVAINRQQIAGDDNDDDDYCSPEISPNSIFPWKLLNEETEKSSDNDYDVVLVVRGTKEIGDVLTDALLDGVRYKSGSAHSGVFQGGKYIVEKHIELLELLRQSLGRPKLRLALVGHSLGAGAAAVAAKLFHEQHNESIEATAVGFGCPAIFSSELAESTKDYVTTVVVDSDVIPRSSGATVVSSLLDMMSFDWTDRAMEDVKQLLDFVKTQVPFDIVPKEQIINFLDSHLDKHDRPFFETVSKTRPTPHLTPPGTCIHLFRDGIGWSGKYTPCEFFNTVDVTRTMLLDHLIPTGYHRALLDFVRDRVGDLSFDFQHDLLALPV